MNNKKVRQGYKIFICLLFLLFVYILVNLLSAYQNYAIYKIPTKSMYPTIKPVSFVVVDKDTDYELGDIIAYKNEENKVIVHRIVDINSGIITAEGDNNEVRDKAFHKSLVVGKVIHIYSMTQIVVFSCIFSLSLFFIIYTSSVLLRKREGVDKVIDEKSI